MAVKKIWYEVMAPEMFGGKQIGETLAADPKQLIGRTLNVSLMDISRNYSKFFVKLRIRIDSIDGNKASTKLVGHECMRERIYRMVQRHGRRVDAVQDVVTKDGAHVRVKTVFMLIKRVGGSTKNDTRKLAVDLIEEAAKKIKLEDFINSIIAGDLQHKLKKDCSKIYPVGSIEIHKTEIVDEKTVAA